MTSRATREAEDYKDNHLNNEKYRYCAEYAKIPGFVTYEIKNAIGEPMVEIYDNLNQKVECVFENGLFEITEQTGLDVIPEDIASQIDVLEIAKMWSKLMTNDLEGLGQQSYLIFLSFRQFVSDLCLNEFFHRIRFF